MAPILPPPTADTALDLEPPTAEPAPSFDLAPPVAEPTPQFAAPPPAAPPTAAPPPSEQWAAPPPPPPPPPPPAAAPPAPPSYPTPEAPAATVAPPPADPWGAPPPPPPPPVPAAMPAPAVPEAAQAQPAATGTSDLPAATLDNGPVALQRNERVTLTSTATGPLQRVMLDLAWEPAPGRLTVDLDASVIAFDSAAKKLEIVWYQHQNEFAGALQHTGDAKGEQGQVAAERVLVDLARLPENVTALVFTINSFHGHTFTDLRKAFCVLSDDQGQQIVTYDLTDTQPSTAVLMAILRRIGPGLWQMRAIGEYHDCRTVKKLIDPAARQVGIY